MQWFKQKKVLIPLAVLVATGVTVSTLALSGNTKPVAHKVVNSEASSQPSTTPNGIADEQTAGAAQAPPASSTATPTPTPTETPGSTTTTVTAPKTVEDLKAEALAKIGSNEQYQCFDQIVQRLYGWSITESEMLKRVGEIPQVYASFCSAQQVVNNTPATYSVGTPQAPPAFRD